MAQGVECNECGERFEMNLTEEQTAEGGLLTAMTCPHCGHRYEIAKTSRRGLALRMLIDRRRGERPKPAQLAIRAALMERTIARHRLEVTGMVNG